MNDLDVIKLLFESGLISWTMYWYLGRKQSKGEFREYDLEHAIMITRGEVPAWNETKQ